MGIICPGAVPIVPASAKLLREDFARFSSTTFRGHYNSALIGTAASNNQQLDTTNLVGLWQYRITAVNDSFSVTGQSGTIFPPLNNQFMMFQAGVQFGNLSTSGERYLFLAGFLQGGTSGYPTDGCGFIYSDNINSGFWQCFSINNGVSDLINTSSAPVASTTNNKLKMYCFSTTGPIIFQINDIVVGTSNNVPRQVALQQQISALKQVGSTQRLFTLDYMCQYYTRSDV